jgi:hypothetical protein
VAFRLEGGDSEMISSLIAPTRRVPRRARRETRTCSLRRRAWQLPRWNSTTPARASRHQAPLVRSRNCRQRSVHEVAEVEAGVRAVLRPDAQPSQPAAQE